jgi:histidinol-phosphate aminotransferase
MAAILAGKGASLRLYPDPEGRELREAVAARYRVRPEQVFLGNGSDEVLAFAFAAFFGDSSPEAPLPLLFPDITYSFYPVYARLWGLSWRPIPLREDFSVDPGDYLVPSGGVVLANPNAPTGRALPVQAILPIAAFLEEHPTEEGRTPVLILDEAYAPFGAESAVPHIGSRPNLLTVHTLSKAWALAGLRVGFAIGSEELIEGLCRVRDSFNSYPLDRLAQAGARAALQDSAYHEEITARVAATRDRVAAALRNLGFSVIPSKANFLFIRHPSLSGADFFAALREQGILVRHFSTPRIADFVRVSIGSEEDMAIFLDRAGSV